MGSQDQRSIETVHDVEFTDTRRETVEKENRTLKEQHPKKVDSLARAYRQKQAQQGRKQGSLTRAKCKKNCEHHGELKEENISRNGGARRHVRHTNMLRSQTGWNRVANSDNQHDHRVVVKRLEHIFAD